MSKIQESVTENCHFQRKGNENQYKHSAEVISNVKEARSILGKSDMNTQKVVAEKERKYLNVSVLYVQERHMMIKLADSPSLRWRKCIQVQLRTVMNVAQRMMLENTNQGGVLHMEREATGAIAVQLLKKSEINTFLSSFNTGINIDKSQINTTKKNIYQFIHCQSF